MAEKEWERVWSKENSNYTQRRRHNLFYVIILCYFIMQATFVVVFLSRNTSQDSKDSCVSYTFLIRNVIVVSFEKQSVSWFCGCFRSSNTFDDRWL